MFIFIIRRGGLGFKLPLIGGAALLFVLFVFGVIGDIRSGEGVIDAIGEPTAVFIESGIPRSYFWAYIYMTSPIANLVRVVDEVQVYQSMFGSLIIGELLPDFLSKHILPLIGQGDRVAFDQISPALNVGTAFVRAYVYSGWFGIFLMAAVLGVLIFIYLKLIEWRSSYSVPGLALLNTFVVFCVFDNMIAFTGMSLQLMWLLLLPRGR